ncbi:MAG: hypothetical protein Q8P06_02390 [Candidatus Azambacteria bacterium]|nr:hypothetical protein [Candidatus Azambacteria bacterium]
MVELNESMKMLAEIPAETPKKEILMIVAVVLIIGLAVGYYFWRNSTFSKSNNAGETADKITESATKGVLPSIGTNPLESKPDVNPADKANPFKNIITNPFE